MSSKFEKVVARHEIIKRRAAKIDREVKQIESLSDAELEKILNEPDSPEPTT